MMQVLERRRWRGLAGMSCAATLALLPLGLAAQERLRLFDGHIHYSVGSPVQYPPEKAIAILDEAGIARALLSSTPNDGTIQLHSLYPERFVPELRPYRKTRDFETWAVERANWYRDPDTVTFLEEELKRGIYRGIGEFHLDGDEADTPVIRKIVDIAVARNLWLHAHSDAVAVEKLFSFNSRARIVWAHAGMSAPTESVDKMLGRYPALWAELSYRDVVAGSGELDPQWKALFLKYPDRFIYGTDTWIPPRWGEVVALAEQARGWLAQLPREVAENIAYRNAERIFGK
ncbi:MAG: amidohydrolase family protein [Betaproteobacteria bacterium]